jgi:DNA-binding IclR family transcriptional regulator
MGSRPPTTRPLEEPGDALTDDAPHAGPQSELPDERDSETLRGVDRALAVLLAFSREAPAWGVTELSERLGLTKSAIHRILRSLMAHGMVTQDRETRAYTLGYRVLALAAGVSGEASLRQVCLPHMSWLRDTTNETIGLYVVAGDVRMCLEELESPQLLRMAAGVGRCFPLDAGAASKALLVDGPAQGQAQGQAQGVAQGSALGPAHGELWRRATGRLSAERRARLEADIADLRAAGYTLTRGETVAGSASIAAPIRAGARNEALAALSIAGPASRFDDGQIARYAPLLLDVASRVSRELTALYGGAAPASRGVAATRR